MDIFFLLFQNLIPLYVIIAVGYIAGKTLDIDAKSLGALCIYIFAPVTAFGFILKTEFTAEYALLPVYMFCLTSVMAVLFLHIGKRVYPDNRANLMSICVSMSNTGFFGLPLVLVLFEEQWVAPYILMDIGGGVFMGSVMYYIAARGAFDVRQSLVKLSRFPVFYATILAFILNMANVNIPEKLYHYHDYFVGAFVVCGMMIIGASLSRLQNLVISMRFIGWTFLGKFIVMPLFAMGFIMLDKSFFDVFSPEIHKLMFLIALVPIGATVAAFAAQLNLRPEKAATTILISTIIALISIPLSLALSGLF